MFFFYRLQFPHQLWIQCLGVGTVMNALLLKRRIIRLLSIRDVLYVSYQQQSIKRLLSIRDVLYVSLYVSTLGVPRASSRAEFQTC